MKKNMNIIRAISNSRMSENDMIFYIQSYLLNWKTVEDIKKECPITVKDYANYYIDNYFNRSRVHIWNLDSTKFDRAIYSGKITEIPNEYDYIVRDIEYDPKTDELVFNIITKEE